MHPNDDEFLDPNVNFDILMAEMRDRLEKLKLDIIHTNDTELKGIAVQLYTDLKIKYFTLMRDDLQLRKLYEERVEDE